MIKSKNACAAAGDELFGVNGAEHKKILTARGGEVYTNPPMRTINYAMGPVGCFGYMQDRFTKKWLPARAARGDGGRSGDPAKGAAAVPAGEYCRDKKECDPYGVVTDLYFNPTQDDKRGEPGPDNLWYWKQSPICYNK